MHYGGRLSSKVHCPVRFEHVGIPGHMGCLVFRRVSSGLVTGLDVSSVQLNFLFEAGILAKWLFVLHAGCYMTSTDLVDVLSM